jgi:hypothetical protein
MITGHVAAAIQWSRSKRPLQDAATKPKASARVTSVSHIDEGCGQARTGNSRDTLRAIEADFQKLAEIIDRAMDVAPSADVQALRRAKRAAERGATVARQSIKPD